MGGRDTILADEILSKLGDDIQLGDYLEYDSHKTTADFAGHEKRLVPFEVVQQMIPDVITGFVTPITTNPFTLASGIISEVPPPMRIFIIRDAGKLEQWPSWPVYDPATGDMVCTVDVDADSYVLVVG